MVHEPVNIHTLQSYITISLLWDYGHTGECVATGGLCRPATQVVQTFKKDGTATISQRRPGSPRKLTPRQERLLMRRVEENRHASSLQLSKAVVLKLGAAAPWGATRWH